MNPKPLRKQAIEIQSRFFSVIQVLIDRKEFRGLKTFCDLYNLNIRKYSAIRTQIRKDSVYEKNYKFIDMEALSYLVDDFGVSATWLLTGKGNLFE